ncbi:unnamed protein product [Symbiodinium natans]|uniref:PA14 domain-containing protein n=1 Tax=Symbiodinium natans TaxID=878477 RepID=A0A812P049_9DINO|nr:unnamed protein product [Symbiodinium natans]
MLYLDGKLVVDNDGCHGPLEKSSIEKFLSPGAHKLKVEMCERGGGETLKLQYSGPDTGNSKVKIPKSALKHAKAGKHVLEGDSYAKGPLVANEGPGVGDLLGGQSMDACNQMCDRISTCYSYALCGDNCHFKNRFVEPWDPRSTKDCRSVYKARKEAFMLNPGDVVALHNQHFNRFVSLKKKDGKLGLYVSPQWPVVDLKDTAEAERFVVMDAGNGEVALYNKHYKRFITMGSGVVSVSSETNDVPPGGVANLLPVADLDGYVGFYSHQTGMFLQMSDQQVMKVKKVAPDQFATSNRHHYTWVKFQVLKAPPPSFGSGLTSAMQVRCSIYGDFGEELAPVRTGLTIDIKDNVCWEKKKVKAAVTREDKGLPEEKCLSKCRMDKTCSHFWWTADSCKQYALRSSGADVTVWVKVPDCGQAAACMEVGGSQDYRTSGLYCPLGQDSHGRVFYQKKAPTLEDSFYMAKYPSDHGKCSTSEWVVQSPSSSDYLKPDVGYYELRGPVQSCVPSADVQVAARGCAKPQAFGPPEEGLPAFVIDDPSTEAPEDFWLHPCDCAPEAWGADLPMNPKTFETIPSGSSNQYIPAPYLIVEGQFACPTRQLRGLHRETETEVMEKADCEAICRMDEHCHLFWHGQQHGASVCRIFSGCDSLVRELGIEGALMAMPKRKLCQVVDAVTCWQTTLRRDYLTREHQVLKPGDTVGLYNEHSKQFVSRSGGEKKQVA